MHMSVVCARNRSFGFCFVIIIIVVNCFCCCWLAFELSKSFSAMMKACGCSTRLHEKKTHTHTHTYFCCVVTYIERNMFSLSYLSVSEREKKTHARITMTDARNDSINGQIFFFSRSRARSCYSNQNLFAKVNNSFQFIISNELDVKRVDEGDQNKTKEFYKIIYHRHSSIIDEIISMLRKKSKYICQQVEEDGRIYPIFSSKINQKSISTRWKY